MVSSSILLAIRRCILRSIPLKCHSTTARIPFNDHVHWRNVRWHLLPYSLLAVVVRKCCVTFSLLDSDDTEPGETKSLSVYGDITFTIHFDVIGTTTFAYKQYILLIHAEWSARRWHSHNNILCAKWKGNAQIFDVPNMRKRMSRSCSVCVAIVRNFCRISMRHANVRLCTTRNTSTTHDDLWSMQRGATAGIFRYLLWIEHIHIGASVTWELCFVRDNCIHHRMERGCAWNKTQHITNLISTNSRQTYFMCRMDIEDSLL